MRFNKIRRAKGMRQANAMRNVSGFSTYPYGTLISYLRHTPGIRGVFSNFKENAVTNGLFNLSLSGISTNMNKWDTDLHLPYTNIIRTSNQFLYSTEAYWSNNSPGWTTNLGLSVGGWIRLTSLPGDWMGIFSAWTGDATLRSWKFYTHNTLDSIAAQLSNDGTSVDAQINGTVALPTNKWIFVCMKWKPTTYLTVKAYFDGDLQEEVSDTSSIPTTLFYSASLTGRLGTFKNSSSGYDSIDGDLGALYYSVVYFDDELEDTIYQLGRKAYKV